MSLPESFLTTPLAHRGLHGPGAPENGMTSFLRAIDHGYGIEMDLQLSSDGEAMVFHDDTLERMTALSGRIRDVPRAQLGETTLTGGPDPIHTLAQILDAVTGRAPLLLELKDQSQGKGGTDGVLEAATAKALSTYQGEVAVMSFNPAMVAEMARLCPAIPRGITSAGFRPEYWPKMPEPIRAHLRQIPDFEATGAAFISHDFRDLDMPRVAELRAQGTPILCWTVKSPSEEALARQVAHNITFEQYLPDHS